LLLDRYRFKEQIEKYEIEIDPIREGVLLFLPFDENMYAVYNEEAKKMKKVSSRHKFRSICRADVSRRLKKKKDQDEGESEDEDEEEEEEEDEDESGDQTQ